MIGKLEGIFHHHKDAPKDAHAAPPEHAHAAAPVAAAAPAAAPAATPAAPASAPAPLLTAHPGATGSDGKPLLVRREIRYMPKADQERWANAVLQMMKNKGDKPETSEFFRCAGYHGWPGQYCTHGIESFPGWHRAYLRDFERALQQADRDLGGDGNVSLPYWDWTDTQGPDGKEAFPSIIRTKFDQPPAGLVASDRDFLADGYQRVSDEEIRQGIESAGIQDMVIRALLTHDHWQMASTQGSSDSVESPHNSIHVIVGTPMNAVPYAAFDPTFWLHHCNVDRVYEKWIQLHPQGEEGFKSRQRQLKQQKRGEDLFDAPYVPFKDPESGKSFQPSQMFSTEALGYHYETLPPDPPKALRALPTYAVFEDVHIPSLNLKTYQIHVFVHAKDKEYKIPDKKAWIATPEYAGWSGVFGGKPGCEACIARDPFRVQVDISAALGRMELAREDAELSVVCIDNKGKIVPLAESKLPTPAIRGPMFEDEKSDLKKTDKGGAPPRKEKAHGDVLRMQKLLKGLKIFGGEIDGWFGDETEKAVRLFQKRAGLKQTGVVDAATKEKMRAPRHDLQADPTAEKATFKAGQTVKYWVGEEPGYLARKVVLKEIQMAFDSWYNACKVKFMRVDDQKLASFEVSWHDKDYRRRKLLEEEGKEGTEEYRALLQDDEFDGPGGQLAHTLKTSIHLDYNEHWMLQNEKDVPEHYYLLPVMVHEVGHALGLNHSEHHDDVMAEFYFADRLKPHDRDLDRLRHLYGVKK